MRETVRAMVSEVEPFDATEAEHRTDVLSWIDSGVVIFRTAKPATPPKHLVSYCVLVDTARRKVMLVDHSDARRWLPTGGHIDPGEHPADAASREMLEEMGVAPAFNPAVGAVPLMVTVTDTAGASLSHTDVSLWFAFESSRDAARAPDEREFADSRWWEFDEVAHAPGTRFDPHLPRFVTKFSDLTRAA